jgi:hypothetical protein
MTERSGKGVEVEELEAGSRQEVTRWLAQSRRNGDAQARLNPTVVQEKNGSMCGNEPRVRFT